MSAPEMSAAEAARVAEFEAASAASESRIGSQVAVDLRMAADVLERDGWTQGVNERNGCRCLMGAMAYVASDGTTSSDGALMWSFERPRLRASKHALAAVIGITITGWNDTPGRTADEVIAALRAAADKADQP